MSQKIIVSIIGFFIYSQNLFALTHFGSVSAGAADTGRASIENSDAVYLNPAAIPHLQGFFFNLNHFNGSDSDVKLNESGMAVTFLDNTPLSIVPASLGYVHQSIELDGQTTVNKDLAFGFGNFLMRQVTMGLTWHQLTTQLDWADETYTQNNLHFGILMTPIDNLGLGFVFYDVLTASKDIPQEYRLKSRHALALNYIYQNLWRFRVEQESQLENKTQDPIWKIGIESFLGQFAILRLGWIQNQLTEKDYYTAGLGFQGPRFQINYAYQMNTKESQFNRHSIDFNIPF